MVKLKYAAYNPLEYMFQLNRNQYPALREADKEDKNSFDLIKVYIKIQNGHLKSCCKKVFK